MKEAPEIDLSTYLIDHNTLTMVPAGLAKKHCLIPIFKIGNVLSIAIKNPGNILAIDDIRNATGLDVEVLKSSEESINQAISQYYGLAANIEEIVAEIEKDRYKPIDQVAEDPPVIKLVNILIEQAIAEKTSDVHIEPEEKYSRIRFRVDGILHEEAELPLDLHPAIVSRIKVMAGMDIAETRVPQDGRSELKIKDKVIDIRVSSYPSVFGEKIVMRLLDKKAMLISLEKLGFGKESLARFREVIKRPYGMILVTGPTGSGKTTTLYSALNTLNSLERNIVTIEDPVEYEIDGITQSQVNVKAGLTFASALRSIVRQDPDVVLVGEIRDHETVSIAVQAAMTGHLVFSTLHTNDAAGTITRIIDMGIEPFLVTSSVAAIIAQRLVRRVCPKCQGKTCRACRHTGYRGRLAIFEQLIVDEKIKKLIIARASAEEIKAAAIEAGMITLRDDGLNKVKEGLTTEEEVLRVTALD